MKDEKQGESPSEQPSSDHKVRDLDELDTESEPSRGGVVQPVRIFIGKGGINNSHIRIGGG